MQLLIAVVLLVLVTVIFTFFVRTSDLPPAESVSPTAHLEERRSAIYENLRDLQFEYRVGKLSEADYQQTKLSLQKELAGVMAEIDRVTGKPTPVPAPSRAAAAAQTTAQTKSAAPAGTVCPHCGATFTEALKFCGECGKSMGKETA